MYMRLKELRKALGLKQQEFGDRLNLSKSSISAMEKGQNALTDRNFSAICSTFNVNPDWLRNGIGDMFLHEANPNDYLVKLQMEKHLSDKDMRILSAYIQMNDAERQAFNCFLDKLLENYQ